MRYFYIIVFSVSLIMSLAAQNGEIGFGLGVKAQFGNISDKNYIDDNNLEGLFQTHRKDFGVDLLYGLIPKVGLISSIGISSYNADIKYRPVNVYNTTGVSLSAVDLLLSQKIFYKLLHWKNESGLRWDLNPFEYRDPKSTNYFLLHFQLMFYPYIGLQYYQSLKQMKSSKGFENLHSEEAIEWTKKYNLPAVSPQKDKPFGNLAFTPGFCFEILFGRKISIYYDFSYPLSLAGSTQIDVEYLYKENIRSVTYKDSKSYIVHSLGLRYYLSQP